MEKNISAGSPSIFFMILRIIFSVILLVLPLTSIFCWKIISGIFSSVSPGFVAFMLYSLWFITIGYFIFFSFLHISKVISQFNIIKKITQYKHLKYILRDKSNKIDNIVNSLKNADKDTVFSIEQNCDINIGSAIDFQTDGLIDTDVPSFLLSIIPAIIGIAVQLIYIAMFWTYANQLTNESAGGFASVCISVIALAGISVILDLILENIFCIHFLSYIAGIICAVASVAIFLMPFIGLCRINDNPFAKFIEIVFGFFFFGIIALIVGAISLGIIYGFLSKN